MSSSPIEHVSDTAFWVATFRARETDRADALFKDPLARVLIGEDGERIASQMSRMESVGWTVVLRTCIIDGFLKQALAEGVDTVLNLGAGLDTRPYRMDLPKDLRWIEVDHPKIIAHKEERLKNESPRCQLERLSLDLSQRELRENLFSSVQARSKKVFVLTEGVLPYLSNDSVFELGSDLRKYSNFEYWVVEYWSKLFVERMKRGWFQKKLQKAPFLFNPPHWEEFFAKTGWKVGDIKYLGAEGVRLKRRAPIPFWLKLRFLTLSKEKRMKLAKMSGYALMRPSNWPSSVGG